MVTLEGEVFFALNSDDDDVANDNIVVLEKKSFDIDVNDDGDAFDPCNDGAGSTFTGHNEEASRRGNVAKF